MCDLPTPVAPTSSTFSWRSTKAHVARSMIFAFGILGLKWKSKSSIGCGARSSRAQAQVELLAVAPLDLVGEQPVEEFAVRRGCRRRPAACAARASAARPRGAAS